MPNAVKHAVIGGGVASIAYLAFCRYYQREVDASELVTCGLVGAVVAGIPDLLEPALTPNHRQLAHSVTIGSMLGRLAWVHCHKGNKSWQEFDKILFGVSAVAYLSHLVADACTPKGLPLLGS